MQNWNNTLLNKNNTMEDAIEILNNYGFAVALIVDQDKKLLGTITDGDIRRALIKKMSLNTKVKDFMFRSPVFINNEMLDSNILKLMKEKDVLQIPIVDKNFCVIGLKILKDLITLQKRNNPIFIMAGGFGTRLKPLTDTTPKPMLHIGNKPILENIIEQFIHHGFTNFYISTHYKSEVIVKYFGNGSNWNVCIKYIGEKNALGTAGSLSLLPYKSFKLPIIMINGDLITKINFNSFLDFHNNEKNDLTIGSKKIDIQVPYGVLETNDHLVTKIKEKPVHQFYVNAGIYVINPKIIKTISNNEIIDMPNWITKIIKEQMKVSIFPIFEYWLDIGEKEQYEKAKFINYK